MPQDGLIWLAAGIFGVVSGILMNHDPHQSSTPKKVRFVTPRDDDEVSVSYSARNGSSKKDRLHASDVRQNYESHGRHWQAAQRIGARSFNEYWSFLSGSPNPDAAAHREGAKYVEAEWKPLFCEHGKLQRIEVKFWIVQDGKKDHVFKEMSFGVPKEEVWEMERPCETMTARITHDDGKMYDVKIKDLDELEYRAFREAITYVIDMLDS
ncbi:MAG: hypothetical protein Q9168_006707 [Polycauliona sp. 1 TL-2023]